MRRLKITPTVFILVLTIASTSFAQQSTTKSPDALGRVTRILVSGDSLVQAQPDTAILTISVVTQAKQALQAQQQNATKTDAMLRAVKESLVSAEIKTGGYS